MLQNRSTDESDEQGAFSTPERDYYNEREDLSRCLFFRLRAQEFCERKLTHRNDVARAFAGMIEAFKIVYPGLPIHHGMITLSLPSEMAWACSHCVNGMVHVPAQHVGIRNTIPGTDLSMFPTWSWHGWMGQPCWLHEKQGVKQQLREMKTQTSLTTDMYIGEDVGALLVYTEKRRTVWRSSGRRFCPPYLPQHKLWRNALMFEALLAECGHLRIPPIERQRNTLQDLSDLGISAGHGPEINIMDWLQRPVPSDKGKLYNVMALSYFEEDRGVNVSPLGMVVMMLLSTEIVDGQTVYFREGLFTCRAAEFDARRSDFTPTSIFLC